MMLYPEHDIERTRKLLPAVEAAVNVVPAAESQKLTNHLSVHQNQ